MNKDDLSTGDIDIGIERELDNIRRVSRAIGQDIANPDDTIVLEYADHIWNYAASLKLLFECQQKKIQYFKGKMYQ